MDAKGKRYPTVLTIAGSDCSGGAGIQADIKTIVAQGCYPASVITALTAQNTQGVQSIQCVTGQFVEAQLTSVFSDISLDAVKIGMIGAREVMDVLVKLLTHYAPRHIVIDPVMIAKGGAALIDSNDITYLKEQLFSIATLITPNIPEAETLTDSSIKSKEDMQEIAEFLGKSFKTNILLKGGHLLSDENLFSPDVLYHFAEDRFYWFTSHRIKTKNTHGTGCTLSSAIASLLAKGNSLVDSIDLAKRYLTGVLDSGKDYQVGHGHGPVHQFSV